MAVTFKGFRVETASGDLAAELGGFRAVFWTLEPLGANPGIRAWAGAQEITAIVVDQFGLSFEGFLQTEPAASDTLAVQIDGGETIDTGLAPERDDGNDGES